MCCAEIIMSKLLSASFQSPSTHCPQPWFKESGRKLQWLTVTPGNPGTTCMWWAAAAAGDEVNSGWTGKTIKTKNRLICCFHLQTHLTPDAECVAICRLRDEPISMATECRGSSHSPWQQAPPLWAFVNHRWALIVETSPSAHAGRDEVWLKTLGRTHTRTMCPEAHAVHQKCDKNVREGFSEITMVTIDQLAQRGEVSWVIAALTRTDATRKEVHVVSQQQQKTPVFHENSVMKAPL